MWDLHGVGGRSWAGFWRDGRSTGSTWGISLGWSLGFLLKRVLIGGFGCL